MSITFAPGPPVTVSCVTKAQATTPVPWLPPLTTTSPPTPVHDTVIASAPLLLTVSVPPPKADVTVACAAGTPHSRKAESSHRWRGVLIIGVTPPSPRSTHGNAGRHAADIAA